MDDRLGLKDASNSKVDEAAGVDDKDPGTHDPPIPYTAYEVYAHLIPEEQGKVYSLEDQRKKSAEMRQFLQKQFGTSSIAHIDL